VNVLNAERERRKLRKSDRRWRDSGNESVRNRSRLNEPENWYD